MGILAVVAGHLDCNGQPLNKAFRSEAVLDRQIDELIGITKGVIADGHVCQPEAEFLLSWLQTNRLARDLWPAKVIFPRLAAILSDGVVDHQEEAELFELLRQCVGENGPAHNEASFSTELPWTRPQPVVTFPGRSFCFTGKFYSGTRNWCEAQVIQRGAQVGGVTKKLDYLVIGEIGSRDWIHSTHGRKIEQAVEYASSGCSIAIVNEHRWHSYLAA